MNNKRQTRLVNLVRKLLELGRSNSNPHEAGLALSRAQRLMAKYGITETEAGLSAIRTADTKGAPSNANRVPEWQEMLLWAVCHAFGCRAFYSWRENSSGTYRRIVTFYGASERPEVAAYAFDVLSRQLKDATAAFLKMQNRRLKLSTRRARADHFRDGWVQGVRSVISGFDVSLPELQLMKQWMDEQNMDSVSTRSTKKCRGDDVARYCGYEAGKHARLHHGVSGNGLAEIEYRGENV